MVCQNYLIKSGFSWAWQTLNLYGFGKTIKDRKCWALMATTTRAEFKGLKVPTGFMIATSISWNQLFYKKVSMFSMYVLLRSWAALMNTKIHT